MYKIVLKEVRFEPVDSYDYIFRIPLNLANTIVPNDFQVREDYYGSESEVYRMAVVADIYTDARHEEVLHCGTGVPLRIYIPVYDPSGGRRICRGYTYSYYEFWTPLEDRMNVEEWRKMVYDESSELKDKVPGWMRELLD